MKEPTLIVNLLYWGDRRPAHVSYWPTWPSPPPPHRQGSDGPKSFSTDSLYSIAILFRSPFVNRLDMQTALSPCGVGGGVEGALSAPNCPRPLWLRPLCQDLENIQRFALYGNFVKSECSSDLCETLCRAMATFTSLSLCSLQILDLQFLRFH